MPSVLTIDQGTTGSTALVLSDDGRILSRAYSEFTQHYPRPGWVEHDANEIWEVTRRVAREALAAAGGKADVRALGITNQRETIVVWDRETGEPVHRAIVWQDRRTAPLCRRLIEDGHEANVRRRTGLVLDPYFSATKLTWLLEAEPELAKRAEAGGLAAGTIDSWLVHRLTGGTAHVTDPTNASRTLLYDIDAHAWDDELLGLFGVPRALLPEVLPSSGEFGICDADALGAELPILGIAGDQQAALFGQGCWHPGLAKQTFGTGAFLLLNTGDERVESKHGLLTTVACGPRGEAAYALEGSVFIAGAAVQWLRDELQVIESAPETEELARSLDSNEGVYLVPAFVGLGAPHWNAEARGAILGLTRGSGRAHFARAALEAMAYGTCEVLYAMVADSGIDAQELRVDGGAAMNDWMLEFLAGIVDRPVRRPALVETTALGAAGLAGLAAGVWRDADEFLESREAPTMFRSSMDVDERRELMDGWRSAVAAVKLFAGAEARS
ncbi:MAG TPA: glycerol kinase GlpK [Longimicrobiales bacterium]|nr:glycerol kinase GlpK [Longimicrobiales bacterium]